MIEKEIEDAKLMLGARLDNDIGLPSKNRKKLIDGTIPSLDTSNDDGYLKSATIDGRIPIRWHQTFAQIEENNNSTFVVCQELLDALPIHVFEYTKRGWRERLIDLSEDGKG